MLTIFTPSFADAANTNAQNLTAKEVVPRLSPEKFRVQMLFMEDPDPRIAARPNTELIHYGKHWNTAKLLTRCLWSRPDIYFFPREGPLDAGFLWARHNLGLKTALVTYVVSVQDRGPERSRLAQAIREADAVVGNSDYVAQTVGQRFGVSATTISSGITRTIFYPPKPARTVREKTTVLYAGSFRPYKRVQLVIREAAKHPSVSFRVAGVGEAEEECRRLATELGCRNVDFLGHLPQTELGEEMRRADIFFFPSELEGHPQVLGQAGACGLPSIALDTYHPDYVVNGKTGFLVTSDEELSEKLSVLLDHLDIRLAFSAAAAEHSLKFDWDRIAESWERVFDSVVRAKRGGGNAARQVAGS